MVGATNPSASGAATEPRDDRNFAAPYVELHLRTSYSFLEGASQPSEIAARALAYGYDALAVTDRNGLYGAMEFAQVCKSQSIRAITGAELTLRHGLVERDSGPVPLVLLVENWSGYANLCRLLTEAHRSSPRDAVALDPTFLAGHTEGLIVFTGPRTGEIPRLVEAGRTAEATEAIRQLAALFGPASTFVELQHNLVYGDTRRVARLAELAAELGLPIVATGDVLYHDRARHRLQDALTAVRYRTTLEASHRLRQPNSEFFLRTPAEAAIHFAAYPEAVANTVRIAERCRAFDLTDASQIGYQFPDFARKPSEEGLSADAALAAYCEARFAERYPPDGDDPDLIAKARTQLQAELELIGGVIMCADGSDR
ncbi:MAG: error-prone polymerase, partial [Chloroflexota bacterium]|nr:error-prone polymerase [Chloroflexota bacterium]